MTVYLSLILHSTPQSFLILTTSTSFPSNKQSTSAAKCPEGIVPKVMAPKYNVAFDVVGFNSSYSLLEVDIK